MGNYYYYYQYYFISIRLGDQPPEQPQIRWTGPAVWSGNQRLYFNNNNLIQHKLISKALL